MDNLLSRLESRLATYKAKVNDLEAAIRVIRQEQLDLDPVANGDPAPLDIAANGKTSRRTDEQGGIKEERGQGSDDRSGVASDHAESEHVLAGDLVGLKIAEAAEKVLDGYPVGQWVSSLDISEQAVLRGYEGRSGNRDKKMIKDSFYHTMKRLTDRFESRGSLFRLRR